MSGTAGQLGSARQPVTTLQCGASNCLHQSLAWQTRCFGLPCCATMPPRATPARPAPRACSYSGAAPAAPGGFAFGAKYIGQVASVLPGAGSGGPGSGAGAGEGAALRAAIIPADLDGELSQQLQKLSKRDATTKLKALQVLRVGRQGQGPLSAWPLLGAGACTGCCWGAASAPPDAPPAFTHPPDPPSPASRLPFTPLAGARAPGPEAAGRGEGCGGCAGGGTALGLPVWQTGHGQQQVRWACWGLNGVLQHAGLALLH